MPPDPLIVAGLEAGAADPALAEPYAALRRLLADRPPHEAHTAARQLLALAAARIDIHDVQAVQLGDHNVQVVVTVPPLRPAA